MPLHNSNNTLKVTMCIKGRILSETAPLDDVAVIAQGPQALESGCMALVRELSQKLFVSMRKVREGQK
jgi:hypothetical protein